MFHFTGHPVIGSIRTSARSIPLGHHILTTNTSTECGCEWWCGSYDCGGGRGRIMSHRRVVGSTTTLELFGRTNGWMGYTCGSVVVTSFLVEL